MAIEGKVAQILSDKYIVITAGASARVKVGMTFVVLAQGEEVKDPGTGEVLGRWEVPKGYLRAAHVQERLTTCEGIAAPGEASAEEASGRVLSAAMIDASMHPETWGGGSGRLDVNRGQVVGIPRIGPISIGDTVREAALGEVK